ncbi:condensin complex subunit 3-like isoform X2 [Tribolium madens]|uniref:condensin complex subunit 3-like isoform X2 n=1 Tax=Tribolium madens TaxID=41895 RepID=UPI001CF765A6|nr:condensin complex subunit 3-like isoform X2 [Tribolium madens]
MHRQDMEQILNKVQYSTSCHQKCVILLTALYKATLQSGFIPLFLELLQLTIQRPSENNIYTTRVLRFLSHFCADVTKTESKETETHSFLTIIMNKVFQLSHLEEYNIRYNSCYFISRVLQDIGGEVQLDVELIDGIQSTLLERMQETKVSIRLVTMSALVRLQDPGNPECPVMKAYTEALCSSSASVRKDALAHIAPNRETIDKIKERVKDVDPSVREAAFHRCGDISPQFLRIVDKHMILMCGFKEAHQKVKTVFYDHLLPKWLTDYNNNYLRFIAALKLSTVEEDMDQLVFLSKKLIKEFYNKHSIYDLLAHLPINGDKLINTEDLSNEVTLFWNILVELLRDSEDVDEHLNSILPDLTPFCNYIGRIISIKSTEQMDEWKSLEYQFDLLNLFGIAENYDYSDEVGKRTMHALTNNLLQSHRFTPKLTEKLVSLAHKCSSTVEFFINDMCQIISEIREPLIEQPSSQDQQRENAFKASKLRVRINVFQEEHNEAIEERDYERVLILENELVKCKQQLEELQNEVNVEKVRVIKSDDETLCCCLDIVTNVLALPAVTKLTPSLVACRDNFLIPLIKNTNPNIHWRIIKCLGLFSLVDKETANVYAKIVSIPIATYRSVEIHHVAALIQSMMATQDLVIKYGIEIISGEELSASDSTSDQDLQKRKLYSADNYTKESYKIDKITIPYLFDIFLDMLDDESDDVRYQAVHLLGILVKIFPITPNVLSRILLKWYNPLTEKFDSHLQVALGLVINQVFQCREFGEIIKESILPTLTTLIRAPRTSPLVDVDTDNVLKFFSEMVNITVSNNSCKMLALDICIKIAENPKDRIVPLLVKLLCLLELNQEEDLTEIIERSETLLETFKDKSLKRHIEKFIEKNRNKENRDVNNLESTNGSEMQETNILREIPVDNEHNCSTVSQTKRRKSRISKECVVLLEKLNEPKPADETTLYTIYEASMEMEVDDSLIIETPTTTSKNSSGRSINVVISETSESDDYGVNTRRSKRCRKKRKGCK